MNNEWTKWEGGTEPPVPGDTLVRVRTRGGVVRTYRAEDRVWEHEGEYWDIMEYQIVLPSPTPAYDDWTAGYLSALEVAAEICDRFQARDVGMQPAECAGAIRAHHQRVSFEGKVK